MKKTIILILLLNALNVEAQTVEEFNTGTPWSFNNGAGLENYGGSESYATFNLEAVGYPNNTNIVIKSPIVDYTNCSELSVSFPIEGIIGVGYDTMRFQYRDGGVWITDTLFTGAVDMTYTSGALPNTLTRFRFKLTTRGTVNFYLSSGWYYYYYYDIASFTTVCTSTLPVDLLYFSGYEYNNNGMLSWATAIEVNNDRFELYHSIDAIEWNMINKQYGQGNSSVTNEYTVIHELSDGINYYQLKQIDYDGQSELFDIVSINYYKKQDSKTVFYNILGQQVDSNFQGLKIKLKQHERINRKNQ